MSPSRGFHLPGMRSLLFTLFCINQLCFCRCVLSVIIRTTTAPPLELNKGVLQFLQRPCEAPAVSLNLLSEINTSTCSCSPSSLMMFGAFLIDSLTNITVSDHSEVCASVSVSKIHTFMSLLLGLQRFIHTFGFKRPPWQQAGLTAVSHWIFKVCRTVQNMYALYIHTQHKGCYTDT